MAGKQEFGFGFGKAHKYQAGHRGGKNHANKNFDGRNDMAVQRDRRHIAVAYRGQRLDAEEEGVHQGVGRQVDDRAGSGIVQQRKEEVDGQIDQDQTHKKLGPGQRQCQVVRVAQVKLGHADLFHAQGVGPSCDLPHALGGIDVLLHASSSSTLGPTRAARRQAAQIVECRIGDKQGTDKKEGGGEPTAKRLQHVG